MKLWMVMLNYIFIEIIPTYGVSSLKRDTVVDEWLDVDDVLTEEDDFVVDRVVVVGVVVDEISEENAVTLDIANSVLPLSRPSNVRVKFSWVQSTLKVWVVLSSSTTFITLSFSHWILFPSFIPNAIVRFKQFGL